MIFSSILKELLSDDITKVASTRRFTLLISSISLCLGFIISAMGFLFGYNVNEEVILGLAAILASLSGGTYTITKLKESKVKNEEHSGSN